MEARKISGAAEARRCLAAAAASGQERAAWARANGVCARSLNAWRLNLERRATGAELRLVELVPAPVARATYRIRYGAFEVEAPVDFDDATLVRLLRVVSSC